MIRHLGRDEIDDKQWNNCIDRSFNGVVYGYSWFLDIVSDDWDALVENDYERIFPLPFKKKFGVKYIYQPFFTQQLGLFSKTLLTDQIVAHFAKSIPTSFKRVDLNLNILNKVEKINFQTSPQINHELDLINSYENIHANYSTNLKRNIKKGKANKLSTVKSIKPDGIIELFKNNRGKEITHLKEENYLMLKRLIYTCMYKGRAKIYGAFNEMNELCAGAFFIISNKKAIFLFSGLNEEGRSKGAMPFLIDRFIQDHANRHLTFDFDGSNNPDLARFYKSFGSKELIYNKLYIDRFSPMASWFINTLLKTRVLFKV